MRYFIMFSFLGLFCFCVIKGIGQNVRNDRLIRSADKTVRYNGWPIPRTRIARGTRAEIKNKDGKDMTLRVLTPITRIVDYEDYYVRSEQEITITSSKRKIIFIWSWSVKGNVFAYTVRYSPYIGPDESAAAVLQDVFLDMDGNGTFEARIHSFEVPALPDWTQKL